MSRVLVAMSGGVDSSVAAALAVEAGHDVTGVTLRLWGGDADRGCCSAADVDDARRVAQQLGIDHYVFNLADDFTEWVVDPYVAAHAAGRTPNPCIECNRTIKFDRLLRRVDDLGYEILATGHHAQVVDGRLRRGVDRAKDQSYVLHMLPSSVLARTRFPVGDRTKAAVRRAAETLGLRTAAKPDSQDVCFVASSIGRRGFLADRGLRFTPARVVDVDSGAEVGRIDAIEMVTVGQRRGLGAAGGAAARYAVDVDVAAGVVRVGGAEDLLVDQVTVDPDSWTWVAGPPPPGAPLEVQCSAHGAPLAATVDAARGVVRLDQPARRVAPGQSVVVYRGDEVLGGGLAG